jgi:Ras family protein
MDEMNTQAGLAPADTAGGSPVVIPRTPLDRAANSQDVGEDAYMEASSARYYLQDEENDEPCCWGLWNYSPCSRRIDALNEALLQTPPFHTADAEASSTSLCCMNLCAAKKSGVAERHTLPRLSSTLIGGNGRHTPGGGSLSNRMSSPASPRVRTSSANTEILSITATPQRPSARSFDGGRSQISGTGVEVVRKVVMLGARNSGKSSVVHRFAERRFGAAYDPTIESTIRAKILIKGIAFMCDLLDTAGQDEYSSFSRQATVGVHGYCMVFSVTSMQSFQAIQKIHDRVTELVGLYTVPIVLVGTKSDDETRREVPTIAGEALADSWGASYVECSAKSDYGIEDVFLTLLYEIERDSGLLAVKDSEDSDESKKRKGPCVIS